MGKKNKNKKKPALGQDQGKAEEKKDEGNVFSSIGEKFAKANQDNK